MSKSKNGKKQSWYPEPGQVRRRIKEMTRAFESSFPDRRLPNNGLGRKWARYMTRTKRLYPSANDHLWLKSWCPWMSETEKDKLLGLKGYWFSGDDLGEHLEVDNEMRKELELWSMRPNDVEWTQVQSDRRERDYMKKQEKRRANGVKARRKGAAEPWTALGMTKSTYYRKRLHLDRETPESAPYFSIEAADSQVSQNASVLFTSGPAMVPGGIRERVAAAAALKRRPLPPRTDAIPVPQVGPVSHWYSGNPMGIYRPDGQSNLQGPDEPSNVIRLSDRRKPTGLAWKPGLYALEIADTGGHGRYLIRHHGTKIALLHNGVLVGTFDTVADAKDRAELGYQGLLAAKKAENESDFAMAA